jgi:hypothetical protein
MPGGGSREQGAPEFAVRRARRREQGAGIHRSSSCIAHLRQEEGGGSKEHLSSSCAASGGGSMELPEFVVHCASAPGGGSR